MKMIDSQVNPNADVTVPVSCLGYVFSELPGSFEATRVAGVPWVVQAECRASVPLMVRFEYTQPGEQGRPKLCNCCFILKVAVAQANLKDTYSTFVSSLGSPKKI